MPFSCTRGVVCFRFWICCGITTLRECRDYYVTRRPGDRALGQRGYQGEGQVCRFIVRDAIEASAREAGLLIARPSWLSPAAAQAVYMRYGKGMHPTARLNLCDCVAYALAKHLNVPLLFKGDDFAATDISPV